MLVLVGAFFGSGAASFWLGPWLAGAEFTAVDAFFAPVAWLLGVPWDDCLQIGQLLGTRMVVNEFVAYLELSGASDDQLEGTLVVMRTALPGSSRRALITSSVTWRATFSWASSVEAPRWGVQITFSSCNNG